MFPKFEELKLAGELPSPSGVGMKVLQLTRREDFEADQLAKTIESDPALTGRLLKIANSARASGVSPITSIREATLRLGAKAVRNVALGFSLMSSSRAGVCAEFDYDKCWSESLGRAVAAQSLAELTKKCQPADAFICGLLSLVGRFGLASVHPVIYGEVIQSSQGPGIDRLLAEESRRFEINHLQVAAALIVEWGLPETFAEAVHAYLQHGRSVRKLDSLTGVMWAAASMVNFISRPAPLRFYELPSFQAAQAELGLPVEAMESFCNRIQGTWAEWAGFLGLPSPEPLKLSHALVDAQRRLSERNQDPNAPVEIRLEASESAKSEKKLEELRLRRHLTEGDGDGVQVLAVDDDPVSLRILTRELERGGFSVVTARDGEEGLRVAMEVCPRVVVTDWQMPKSSGIDLTKAIRAWGEGSDQGKGQDIYIIILTGNEKEDQLVEAFEAGADDYVVKPLKPRVLAARLRAALRVVRLQEALALKHRELQVSLAQEGVRNRQLERASLTDPLTGLDNRRSAMKILEAQWAKAHEDGTGFAVIMGDIDKFKLVNDTFGHDVGDEVLKATAEVMRRKVRTGEVVCRLGGEEFLVVCRGADVKGASIAAERLRKAIEDFVIPVPGFNRAVTMSLGVAAYHTGMSRVDELLKAADVAVYQAKNNGRNRVEVTPTPEPARAR